MWMVFLMAWDTTQLWAGEVMRYFVSCHHLDVILIDSMHHTAE